MNRIYMDNAATTRVTPPVLEAMMPCLTDVYGNPSSVHAFGRDARRLLDEARARVAAALNAKPSEIYFTGCGTESDNWAVRGSVYALKAKGNHIITSSIEHHAILHTCQQLEREGFKVTYLPVDEYGQVSVSDVEKAITPETTLISIMTVGLLIEEIAPAANRLPEHQRGRAQIDQRGQRNMPVPAEQERGQQAADHAAVYGQPALAQIEYRKRMRGIALPGEYHIVGTGADHRQRERQQQEIERRVLFEAQPLLTRRCDDDAQHHGQRDQYAVPVNGKAEYIQRNLTDHSDLQSSIEHIIFPGRGIVNTGTGKNGCFTANIIQMFGSRAAARRKTVQNIPSKIKCMRQMLKTPCNNPKTAI